MAAVVACWRGPAMCRRWLLIAAVSVVCVMVTYASFFAGANEVFVRGSLSDSAVRSLRDRWATWHCIRTGRGGRRSLRGTAGASTVMTLHAHAWLALAILAGVMCALLFGTAGTTQFWQAWVYVSIFLGASVTSPAGRDADVTDQREVLTRAYAAFNARDIDAVLAAIEILHHKRSKERSKAFLHPREIKSKAGRHDTHLIVPPINLKEFNRRELHRLMRRGKDVLSTPKKLIVLGYSLPATDPHAQYIFPVRLSQPDGGSAEERRSAETFSVLGNPGPGPCGIVEAPSSRASPQRLARSSDDWQRHFAVEVSRPWRTLAPCGQSSSAAASAA